MFSEFCTDKVNIVSVVSVKDAAGGMTRTPTTLYTGVFCSIQDRGGDQALQHAIEGQSIISDVYFIADYGFKVGWEIRPWIDADTAPTATSRTLRVKAYTRAEPWQDEVYTVIAEERS